jgi:hypothetical protein
MPLRRRIKVETEKLEAMRLDMANEQVGSLVFFPCCPFCPHCLTITTQSRERDITDNISLRKLRITIADLTRKEKALRADLDSAFRNHAHIACVLV